VELKDLHPGVPGPTSATEGPPGELLLPIRESRQSSFDELAAGASTSHPDATGLKGASDPRAPGASVPQDSGMVSDLGC